MALPVLPALFKEMAKQRTEKGRTRKEVALACEVDERTVERWENGKNLPVRAKEDDPGGDLARAVEGYALILDVSEADLWAAGIVRAGRERKAYEARTRPKHGPSQATLRAVAALRRHSKT
jgi:transcriptional regulator with XRE-family HTH domain